MEWLTLRCGTLRVSLCKCSYWNTLDKVIYFSFNQKCSFLAHLNFTNVHSLWLWKGRKSYPTIIEKYPSTKVAWSSFQDMWHNKGLLSSFQVWQHRHLPRWQISSGPCQDIGHINKKINKFKKATHLPLGMCLWYLSGKTSSKHSPTGTTIS